METPGSAAEELMFVSYARSDGVFALRLATELRAEGVHIWMDQLDLRAGDTWDRAVEAALKRCTHLLVVLSPASVASRSVMDEVSYALDENKATIPVLHRACEIPFRLRRVQRTDFSGDYAPAFRQLLTSLRGAAGHDGRQENPAGGEKPLDERRAGATTRSERLFAALWVGLGGAAFCAIASVLIFANDPRFDGSSPGNHSVLGAAGMYSAASAVLWALTGAAAGSSKPALVGALAAALAVLVAWFLAFGTYQDVLATGVSIGAPIAGFIGAMGGRFIVGRRAHAQSVLAARR